MPRRAGEPVISFGPMNRGIDNTSPVNQINLARSVTAQNIEFIRTGGWKIRPGSVKKSTVAFNGRVIGIYEYRDRDNNVKFLIFCADGTVYDYDGSTTFTEVIAGEITASDWSSAVNFYKEDNDFLIYANGGRIKKIYYYPNGSFQPMDSPPTKPKNGVSVSATKAFCASDDEGVYKYDGSTWAKHCGDVSTGNNVTDVKYVSDTELYAGTTDYGLRKCNGTAWSSALPAEQSLNGQTIGDVMCSSTTPYAAIASVGVCAWHGRAWRPVGSLSNVPTTNPGLYVVSDTEIYTVADATGTRNIKKWNGSSWSTVQSITSLASEYKFFYLNGVYLILARGSFKFWTSTDKITWTERTFPNAGDSLGLEGVCYDGANYVFSTYHSTGGVKKAYIEYTSDFVNFTYKLITSDIPSMKNTSIAFGNGYICMCCETDTSLYYVFSATSAGGSWSQVISEGIRCGDIKYYASKFRMRVLSSYTNYWFDTDWTTYSASSGLGTLQGHCSSAIDTWVGVCVSADTSPSFSYTTNGTSWSFINNDDANAWNIVSLSYISGRVYVAPISKDIYYFDTSTSLFHQVGSLSSDAAYRTLILAVSSSEAYVCANGGTYGAMKWNGSTWSSLWTGYNVNHIYRLDATHYYVSASDGVYLYNGSTITDLSGSEIGVVDVKQSVAFSSSLIYAATAADGVIFYNGAWSKEFEVGSNVCSCIFSAAAPSVDYLFAGETNVSVHKFDSASWQVADVGDRSGSAAEFWDGTVTTPLTDIVLSAGDTSTMHAGDYVVHSNIPDGAYIASVVNINTIRLNVKITAGSYSNFTVVRAPNAKFIEIYNGILFAAYVKYGGITYNSQISYSRDDEVDIDSWHDSTSGLRRLISIDSGDNDSITMIKAVNGRLGIWKENSVWVLSGTSADDFYLQRLASIGCVAGGSVQNIIAMNGSTYSVFMSDTQFYICDGASVNQTDSMKYYTFDIDKTKLDQVRSCYDRRTGKYKVSFYVNGGGRKTVVYQPQLDAFSEETNYADCFGILSESQYFSDAEHLYLAETGTDDEGVAISWAFKTGLFSLGTPDIRKVFRKAIPEYRSNDGDFTINLYVENKSDPYYTIIKDNVVGDRLVDDIFGMNVQGRYIQFEILGSKINSVMAFYAMSLKYRPIGER